ncbi:MAG: AraC family transcriptional regulator [Sedimentitalea sp.]
MDPFQPEQSDITLSTLAQMAQGGGWQLELAHDRAEHLLIWITRGQGVMLLDGTRRGLGLHNAVFVPARQVFSIDMGRQSFGQVLSVPSASALTLPDLPLHLRIRDVASQVELTAHFEALGREQNAQNPLCQSAMAAYGELAGIWVRRQMLHSALPGAKNSAALRLSRAFCARLSTDYASGANMADHAAALGVTPTHLTRVCRAQTGKTAAALLGERLVHAARRLLGETRAPIQDIASHLGFGSAAYFTRFIQHHCGRAPSALRGD